MVVLYIIQTVHGTYYTGITNSIIRRWKEHKSGRCRYTREHRPKEVVHIEVHQTRVQAARKERKVKRIGAKKYMLKLRHRK